MARRSSKESKLERLYQAAARVFSEKGFERGTMSEVAQRAGVGKGTIYLYFSSKEDLFVRLCLSLIEKDLAGLENLVGQAEEPVRLAGALLEYGFKSLIQFNEYTPLYLDLWGRMQKEGKVRRLCLASFRNLYERYREVIRRVIEAGRAAGLLTSGVDARSLAILVIALFDGLQLQAAIDPEGVDLEKIRRDVTALLMGGLAGDMG